MPKLLDIGSRRGAADDLQLSGRRDAKAFQALILSLTVLGQAPAKRYSSGLHFPSGG